MPDVARPFARRSERLADIQQHLGLALGGEAGSRMARRLSIPASPDTLIRMVCTAPLPAPPAPKIIGIDEWAWRKGHRYAMADRPGFDGNGHGCWWRRLRSLGSGPDQ